jgi:hypothetical protein
MGRHGHGAADDPNDQVTFIWEHVLGGFRLLGTSTAFYFTSPLVLAVAVVPAAVRSYQLFSGDDNGWLELLVETLRVGLVAVMVATARQAVGAGASPWAALGSDVVRAYRTGFWGIVIQLTVVTLVVLAFNAVFESLVTTSAVGDVLDALHWDASVARETTLAITFAVKNFLVIPLYIAAMLIASGVIRPR